MTCYAIDGISPVVDPNAFVHESAVLIGDVIIGAGCYVGPCASLRGDFGRVVMQSGSNVQDTCVMHAFPGKDVVVEKDGHIGHGAVLHGCTIGQNALVGMNAVVMDDAVIGAESIVAACAFVKSKFCCPERSLLVGSPARIVRTVSDEEIGWKTRGTEEYQVLTERCQETLQRVEPLPTIEPDRKRIDASAFAPKGSLKD